MANVQTIGRILVEDALPEDIRKDFSGRVLNKKEIGSLFNTLAEKHQDKYVDILQNLNDLGRDVATEYGGVASISLKDLHTPPKIKAMRDKIAYDIRKITQDSRLKAKEKNEKVTEYMLSISDKIKDDTLNEAYAGGNAMALQAKQGIKGNSLQLAQTLFGDMLMADQKGRPVPIVGLHGYNTGITPAELWAGSYGNRAGYYAVQFGTAEAGFLGKQVAAVGQNVVVTEEDCGASDTGVMYDGSSTDVLGSVLAAPVGDLKPGHVLGKADLKKVGKSKIRVRSALTCQAEHGICQKCAGKREDGQYPEIGSYLGVTTGRIIAEPLTQMKLCLHEDQHVKLADGTTTAVKDILPGMRIMGADTKGTTKKVKVLSVINNGTQNIYKFDYAHPHDLDNTDIRSIMCTTDHKILDNEGAMVIAAYCYHPRLITEQGIEDDWMRVGYTLMGTQQTYDLEVDSTEHLFLTDSGFIVHNSEKHTGGAMGKTDKIIGGFEAVDQMFQVPKNFIGKSILAPEEGLIKGVKDAPQGGKYLFVNDTQLYVPQDIDIKVKKGDVVDAGDILTTGTPNPAEIVKYKGIGEGRRYFTNALSEILDEGGAGTHKRNVEAIARGFIDKVRITKDEFQGHTLGDAVNYSSIQRNYEPREDAQLVKPSLSKGTYLEKPVLHYTIGTKITNKVMKDLKDNQIDTVLTHKESPGFEPFMVRPMDYTKMDEDWKARLGGWHIKSGFLDSVQTGGESKNDGISYIPKLMNPSIL